MQLLVLKTLSILEVIKIKDLRIINNTMNVGELFIDNINNLLVLDYKMLYSFINCFINDANSTVFIGNNKIDSKSSYIINLLDYESIANQLTLKKGTLIYDYLIDEISSQIEISDIQERLEYEIKRLVDEVVNEKTIEYNYDFSIDINKIVTNYIKFDIDLDLNNYVKIIRKLIYNLIEKKTKKTIVLLVNSNIFNNELDEIDRAIVFKFFSEDFPNIIIGNDIINIDKGIIMNQIELNWPCEISNNEIKKILTRLISKLNFKSNIITTDFKEYICCKIISKSLNISIRCSLIECNLDDIPEIYKKFIKSLN